MNFWLFKSEPDAYSIDDLKNEKYGIGRWDGIRNYQARNLLRDQVKQDDMVLFYHSNCKKIGIAGCAKVVSPPYPDPLQFTPESKYYDPKSNPENPRWLCIDIQYQAHAKNFISLKEIKTTAELENMVLLKQGRLSIQPVTKNEWNCLIKLTKMFE